MLRDDDMIAPAEFLKKVADAGITIINLPTAFWVTLVSYLESEGTVLPESVHTVIIGGEAVHSAWIRKWRRVARPKGCLLNSYGATEITAISLLCDLDD